MTCKSASGESVVPESVPSESLVPVHRVPREGPAASASAEAMMPRETMSATATVAVAGPTVTDPRLPSPAVTGPPACRPATCAALSGPTASVMAVPAMMRVARKFKSLPVGKTLATPASLRAPTFAIESCLAEATLGKFAATEALVSKATFVEATLAALAPGKLGPFAGTAGFGTAGFGPWSAFPCRSAWTPSALRSCSRTGMGTRTEVSNPAVRIPAVPAKGPSFLARAASVASTKVAWRQHQ